ncbi:MAG: lactate utilization protein [Thermoplasmatota archaeon]
MEHVLPVQPSLPPAAARSVPESISRLLAHLEARHFSAEFAPTWSLAKAAVLRRIPEGAAVMAGSSTTLDEIGVTDALRTGPWDYLRAKVWSEPDPVKRQQLRTQAMLAPYFLGSVAAITEDGVLIAADSSGSRVAAYLSGPQHVIVVASIHKVVPNLAAAIDRVERIAVPLEQERVNRGPMKYESKPLKWALLYGEAPHAKGRTHVILVGDKAGF